MTGLFVIVLLAAIAGIVKPYIRGLRRTHFIVVALVAFVLVGVTAPKTSDSKDAGAVKNETAGTMQAAGDATPKPATKWEYSEDKDSMRGTTSRFASLKSENQVDLDFPYGVVSASLIIRKRPEDGLNIMFSVDKGQILCHSFTNSKVSIKFDDKTVQSFSCTTSSDGSTETAFLGSEARLLVELKKAKKVIVEAEFFQKGRQQFEFDTAGLDWK